MNNLTSVKIGKIAPLLVLASVLLLLSISPTKIDPAVFSSPGENKVEIKTSPVKINTSVDSKTGENKVNVNVNNSNQTNQNSNGSVAGTCTVTKNGVTETVPAGQVNVNEYTTSGGSIEVNVNCNNSSASSNNSTSVQNKVEVHTNSSGN